MFYRETRLTNGVTVITESIDTVRSVALGVWFAVGSRDETEAEAGMSHFMEHMMFKGTPQHTAAQISEAFDSLGAELNAFTSKEYTCYYARFVDEHLEKAVSLLSEMVVDSLLADDACDSEREVVIEEIARMEDTPDDRIHEMFGHALWPDHPIGLPILGSRESVGGFNNAKSLAFRDRHYLTGNCVVAAAGNLDHDQVVRMVEKYLSLPEGPRSTRPAAIAAGASRLAVLTKETEQTHICYGMASLNAHHEDRFALSVIDTVLGGGMSSRLFQEIREKKGLAYAVYSFQALYQDTGQFAVYAGTRPSNTEQVFELIQAEVERMRLQGMTAEELTLAKDSIKGHMVLGLESTRNRMTRLGKNRVTDGELLSVDEIVARIDSLTLDDVGRVAADVLAGEKILAMIGPHESKDVQHLLS
ncbi:MAG: insulinase family protein [Actinobacteria bacterium]|nr:insulinase family protein [Actinomycetota bacterium]MCG2807423.1 insulinase family protein [Coriobacteriia bacterium]